MRKVFSLFAVFTLAVVIGLGAAAAFATQSEAARAPIVCKLTFEPFLVCEESPRCKGEGELYCYECQGYDLNGEPCLCSRVGCMVP